MSDDYSRRMLAQFDAAAYVVSKGARRESMYSKAQEYLMICRWCGSGRLRFSALKHQWICWGCGRTGDTYKLIAMLEGCNEFEAVEFVQGQYVGGDAKTAPLVPLGTKVAARNPLRVLPAIDWPGGVDVIDVSHPVHQQARGYLLGRGLTDADITNHRLGVGRTGRLMNRIVFPVYMQGVLVYWQARAMWDPPAHLTKQERSAWIEQTEYRKTINPILKDENEAGSSEVLYGLDTAYGRIRVVIVEGPIDKIKVGPQAVALLGKAHTPPKIARLQRMRGVQQFVLYLDRGREERRKAEELAAELSAYAHVSIAEPPEGYDPGMLSPEQNAYYISQAVAWRRPTLRGV